MHIQYVSGHSKALGWAGTGSILLLSQICSFLHDGAPDDVASRPHSTDYPLTLTSGHFTQGWKELLEQTSHLLPAPV